MEESKMLKYLSPEELKELIENNEWLRYRIGEEAQEDLSTQQNELMEEMGIYKAFEVNSHYESFYLSLKNSYGLKDWEVVAEGLNPNYLSTECLKDFEALKALKSKYDDMEEEAREGEEGEELEIEALELAEGLAHTIGEELHQEFETAGAYDIECDFLCDLILDGGHYLSTLEATRTDGGELGKRPAWRNIKEVVMH